MKRINLLFLVLSLNVGGTERHIYNLVSKLNRERYNVVICCLFDLGYIGGAIRGNCKDIKIYHNIVKNKFDVFGLQNLISIVRKENVHILYTINSPLTQFWGMILARLTGAACITRVATTKSTFHVQRRRMVNKFMLHFVDVIIAQADSHKAYLVNSEGMKEEKVKVIYNGVEQEKFNITMDKMSLREEIGLKKGNPVIGIVARLAPEKGHEILIKAARKVIDVFPNAHFLVIGDGKLMKKLEDLAQELKIRSKVVFLGARSDVPQLLSILDVAVLTSYPVVETFSNSILEYMASGRPVVATNAGSTADQVLDGETGYIVPCGDSAAIASSIIHLLENPELLKKMGEAGRKRIEKKFTIWQMMEKYDSLFTRLSA